jgi:DNA-binding HxlR family transcriptional regulator
MRSYGQYCGLAKALDTIGDRWSLLIVRELLLRGACRYTDLREGLPGIATNLLADRLRELERAGVIEREDAPPPVATTLFRLTDLGQELRPAVHALAFWGGPLLDDDYGTNAFQSHWLALPVQTNLGGRIPEGPPVTVGVHAGREDLVVHVEDGTVETSAWTTETPDVTLTGSPKLILALLIGGIGLEDARARGLECEGDVETLRRILAEGAVTSPVPR